MKTIPRNHAKRIAALRATLGQAWIHSLETGFAAEPIDPARAWAALDRGHARLIDQGDGRYSIRVNSNLWFDLRA